MKFKLESLSYLPFILFGLWWIMTPTSVANFYNWLHKGKVELPSSQGIRGMGILIIVVVVILALLR
ncbi:MAG: hypothetical protein CVV03_12665 [Firmicutes bacterium HGW-Firmicutes-8]|nr:MAG: hypothetical protein CVV03_12665 [Firmicutes bacterium HGW-Firmicutes-8]